MKGHPHVGDRHIIRLTAKISDRADAAVIPLVGPVTFRFRRPDGTTFDVDAELTSDGTDGQAEYTTLPDSEPDPDRPNGDLDQAGDWEVQLKDADGPWHADKGKFRVLDNLTAPPA